MGSEGVPSISLLSPVQVWHSGCSCKTVLQGTGLRCRAAQERLPYAEEVLVLASDVEERLQRIAELEHQVLAPATPLAPAYGAFIQAITSKSS